MRLDRQLSTKEHFYEQAKGGGPQHSEQWKDGEGQKQADGATSQEAHRVRARARSTGFQDERAGRREPRYTRDTMPTEKRQQRERSGAKCRQQTTKGTKTRAQTQGRSPGHSHDRCRHALCRHPTQAGSRKVQKDRPPNSHGREARTATDCQQINRQQQTVGA